MKRRSMTAIACALMALAATPAGAQKVSAVKQRAVSGVEARAKLAQEINDSIFSFGELGFQEVETSRYVTEILEKNGFAIERNVAGLPTGWVARWSHGEGGPVIALGSDIDGIPKASQKPGIPYHSPLVEGAPGHGEGHNSGQAVNVVAALAVKEIMERDDIKGSLVLWPGVAEELLGGKAYMVRDGVFEGVDAVLFTHVSDNLGTAWGQPTGTGLVSVEYSFHGDTAHSAGAPWRGRSALDAVELMNMGWNMRREHLRPEQRSHYVITDGGDQPNVVPSIASVWYYIREQSFAGIAKNFEIANTIAEAAAKMTDTTVTRRIIGAAAPRHFNRPMAEAAYANIRAVGLPNWTADEQAFAKAVQRNINAEKVEGLDTELDTLAAPVADPKSGGSDDIGDISWTIPTITIGYPANIPNLPGHNWVNAVAMATPIAHKGVVAGAKVVAMTTIDLLTRPSLLRDARDYFDKVQTKDQKYAPVLASTDKPAVELNTEIMARFRPQMREFYYDPSRYATYLEQLGIKFPILDNPPR
ncbi:amidohydrolase [Sphingosinicella rhizophila]|uniref:Amidohydrolase n=1 Tax=Sphingosinicella rhizophila TaxID=3050082 RepID=A0ABU3Q7Y6_9SPHN|nr:amidohydrolase [Sphingosinicella sp. GR2756]MDT9599491.1 amidohydrolase [Sphingosinicella sp. GR2756]